jgi:hypothetical protein
MKRMKNRIQNPEFRIQKKTLGGENRGRAGVASPMPVYDSVPLRMGTSALPDGRDA